MTKWIFSGCLLLWASLLTACSASIAPVEVTATPTQPAFSNLLAETNRLYDQLEANTPIEVAPANASVQTGVLTMPTLF
ncbi:MAG: hypothetical protein DPW09_40335 [Anaerolineae bacterium]|nr:hypothetical protein [Anaerolineae bacterium]